jgi:hypothetical protein
LKRLSSEGSRHGSALRTPMTPFAETATTSAFRTMPPPDPALG